MRIRNLNFFSLRFDLLNNFNNNVDYFNLVEEGLSIGLNKNKD